MSQALEKERATLPAKSPRRTQIDSELKGLNLVFAKAGSPSDETDKVVSVNTGIPWFDKVLLEKWKKNPGLMLYKLQANGYKFSWLLIPLSIPFVWLLFPFSRRFGLYDHTVFVTYSLCFMTLLGIVVMIGVRFALPGLGLLALAGLRRRRRQA